MNKHIETLCRHLTHDKVQIVPQPNSEELLDAVKWAAKRREGVVLPNGVRWFVDWKGAPASEAAQSHDGYHALRLAAEQSRTPFKWFLIENTQGHRSHLAFNPIMIEMCLQRDVDPTEDSDAT